MYNLSIKVIEPAVDGVESDVTADRSPADAYKESTQKEEK